VDRTIIFYRTEDGKCPVQDFLDALPGKVAQKAAWVLRLLEDLEMVSARRDYLNRKGKKR
jgi:hypothetical protein